MDNCTSEKNKIIEQLKKIKKKSEICRQAYSLLHNFYAKFSGILHLLILIFSCFIATLTFADYSVFNPIFKNLTEGIYKLISGGVAGLIFSLIIVEESFKPGNLAKEYSSAVKLYTELIRNIHYAIETENIEDDEARKIIEKYNFISGIVPLIPDKIFKKAKKSLIIKIEISKLLDKNPYECIWIYKLKKNLEIIFSLFSRNKDIAVKGE